MSATSTVRRPVYLPDPPARLHLIGLKGVAMTALAELLRGQGYEVTGSDTAEQFGTDDVLRRLGLHCAEGFAAENVSSATAAVIYSTAYPSTHVERRAAQARGLPAWSYPEVVGMLFQGSPNRVAVAGSHGKTTTSALLARMLEEGGLDPTAVIGSTVVDWGRNARLGSGSWFVLEADEYQNKLEHYDPRYLLVTNVDYDHPDFFPSRSRYEQAFLDFAGKVPSDGALVVWAGEPLARRLGQASAGPCLTYGREEGSDWRLSDVRITDRGTSFTVFKHGQRYGQFLLPVAGEHYALDALGALVIADLAGVTPSAASRAVANFRGTARRMEYRGEYRGAVVLDDYAHHPAEIAATLTALRSRYPGRRLWCVFQPHTFSRTAAFLEAFAAALTAADRVVLLPIYASARESVGAVTSEGVADTVNHLVPGKATATAGGAAALALLREEVGTGDVVVTMGAGDVWRVAQALTKGAGEGRW